MCPMVCLFVHDVYAANRVFAFASHGVFSGPASKRITNSDLDEVVVANTIPLNEETKTNSKIVHVRFCVCLLVCYAYTYVCVDPKRK